MKTINLSDAQVKSLGMILSQNSFSAPESTIYDIIFRLNSYTDGHDFKFSVPAPKPPGVWPNAPIPPQGRVQAQPAPFDDLKALRIAEAVACHGDALMELRRDRDGHGRPAMSSDNYMTALHNMRGHLQNLIWEITNDCIGYTADRKNEEHILRRAADEPFVMEKSLYPERLIQKLLDEGKLTIVNVQTEPKETTVKKA